MLVLVSFFNLQDKLSERYTTDSALLAHSRNFPICSFHTLISHDNIAFEFS